MKIKIIGPYLNNSKKLEDEANEFLNNNIVIISIDTKVTPEIVSESNHEFRHELKGGAFITCIITYRDIKDGF